MSINVLGFDVLLDEEDEQRLLNEGKKLVIVAGNHGVDQVLLKTPRRALARYILNVAPKSGTEVDHINRDALDNRKENLREVTKLQNLQNRGGWGSRGEFKGVSFTRKSTKSEWGMWMARITVNGERIYLGKRKTEIEAAALYNEAAVKYFGEFAQLNKIPQP